MSKLKKLQKERLIVARLGFPDKAMEIDKMIEAIRADLKAERAQEDERILSRALENFRVKQEEKVKALETTLRQDEQKLKKDFSNER
ncbi:unnamed protein product, partial [Choristocarpus tenellus]